MNEWHDLFVATSGSAAALTGLIFVGVSINLNRILSFPRLADRALVSLALLFSILIVSILMLVPEQAILFLGLEIIVVVLLVWIMILKIDLSIYANTAEEYKKQYRYHLLFNQVAIYPYLIAGVSLLVGVESGVYWIVPSICFCFFKSIWDAWILLVEINR